MVRGGGVEVLDIARMRGTGVLAVRVVPEVLSEAVVIRDGLDEVGMVACFVELDSYGEGFVGGDGRLVAWAVRSAFDPSLGAQGQPCCSSSDFDSPE